MLELRAQVLGAQILIVDDQEANLRLLEALLERTGYTRLTTTTDSRQVTALFRALQPDLILLDLSMPHLDGFAVMGALHPLVPAGSYLPILVLTADISRAAKQRALAMGAKDFLTKPFDPGEVLLRIQNLLEARILHQHLQHQNGRLEEQVAARTQALERVQMELDTAQMEILERLARAAEYRDDQTGRHTRRVGQTSARVARILGLPERQVELLRRAAPLHDVGKIAIPDAILLKPARLTAAEFAVIQTHTTIGAALLAEGRSPLTLTAERIALTHHERWDGGGYPHGLEGAAIPIEGRIVAVADVFDALTHERPYKRAWPLAAAHDEIRRQSGGQFDPAVVAAFLAPHD